MQDNLQEEYVGKVFLLNPYGLRFPSYGYIELEKY